MESNKSVEYSSARTKGWMASKTFFTGVDGECIKTAWGSLPLQFLNYRISLPFPFETAVIAMPQELNQIKELQRRIALYEDELAYKKLFFIFFSSLTRFSAAITRSKEQAEEIVSDVFIQLWNNRKSLQEIEDLKLYLFTAVKNNSVHKLHQTEKKKTISIDDLSVEMDSLYQNPEDKVLSTESMQSIERAIQNLPPRARLILKLAKEDRLRYKDIASLLNISVKTIDHQLAIALKKLTETLGASIRKKR